MQAQGLPARLHRHAQTGRMPHFSPCIAFLLRPTAAEACSFMLASQASPARTSEPQESMFVGMLPFSATSLALSVSSAFCCTSHHCSPSPVMADLEASSDTASALRALLANARGPDMLAEHILGVGFEDVADFAYV